MVDSRDVEYSGYGEVFQIRDTVWDLVLERCPNGEIEEVKRLLGTSLVEQLNDLQDEVSTVLEIWRQMREDSNATLKRPSKLAEPPYIREALIKEIKFFLDSLHKRSETLPPTLGKVVNYVNLSSTIKTEGDYCDGVLSGNRLDKSSASKRSGGGGSRPDSAVSSWDGRETPVRYGSSSGRQSSSLDENYIGEINDHINSTSIDQVISKLRDRMELDCEQCRMDLHFLQSCIDGEQHFVDSIEQQQEIPTLPELRELGTKLEKEFLSSTHNPSITNNDRGGRLVPIPPPGPKPQGLSVNRASKVHRNYSMGISSGNGESIAESPSEKLSILTSH